MIPQPCTEDLSSDTGANKAQYSGISFNCKPEKHCLGEIKYNNRISPVLELREQPKLCTKKLVIAPGLPFHPTGILYLIILWGDIIITFYAVVTGQIYRDPKHMDCYEVESQYVSVGCPNISDGKTPEKPPLPQLPVNTSIHPETTEKQLPQAPEKDKESTKMNQPFKKRQWSNPPGS